MSEKKTYAAHTTCYEQKSKVMGLKVLLLLVVVVDMSFVVIFVYVLINTIYPNNFSIKTMIIIYYNDYYYLTHLE